MTCFFSYSRRYIMLLAAFLPLSGSAYSDTTTCSGTNRGSRGKDTLTKVIRAESGNVMSSESIVLSSEAARGALVRLSDDKDKPELRAGVSFLQNAKLEELGDGKIKLGSMWMCDLQHQTFVFSAGDQHIFYQCEGVFVREKNGKWKAVIQSETRN